MKSRPGSRIALGLIVLAAIALQQSATRPWGSASPAPGARIEVSPIGLVRFDSAGAAAPVRAACRWWPKAGDAALCALTPDGARAMNQLRWAYPAALIGMWCAVAALFLQVLSVPRSRAIRVGVTWLTAAIAASGVAGELAGAPAALASLQGAAVVFRGSGYWMSLTGIALSLVSGVMHLRGSRPSGESSS